MQCNPVQGSSMPMSGESLWRNSKSVMRRLFGARLDNNRNLVLSWLLLQVYLVSNLLSFGFWKVGNSFFVYSILFFSVWFTGLAAVLLLFLWIEKHKGLTRFKFKVLAIVTFPFFWLWGASLQLELDELYVFFIIAFPFVIAVYYRIGQSNIAGVTVSMLALSTVSFFGHAGMDAGMGADNNLQPSHPNMDVADITLDRTPNIHVIMFDALTNSEFSREFLGQGSVGADYLAQLDDSIYAGKMSFCERVPTIQCWDALFGLGILGPGKSSRSLHFSGALPSPLSHLLRENGYMIQTGYANAYFGQKGPHVDHYHLRHVHSLTFSDIAICREKLFGLCNKRLESTFQKVSELVYDKVKEDSSWLWEDQVFDIIEKAETRAKTPVFSGFYLLIPGHTKPSYVTGSVADLEEYKSVLASESERVQSALERLNELRLKFPESIFIVSGDHGAWLSNTMSKRTRDRRFWVLDRYGVALALLNEHNLCPISRAWLERQRYLTPTRFLAASLACNGDSQKLLEIFSDRKEFITFGESLATLQ